MRNGNPELASKRNSESVLLSLFNTKKYDHVDNVHVNNFTINFKCELDVIEGNKNKTFTTLKLSFASCDAEILTST